MQLQDIILARVERDIKLGTACKLSDFQVRVVDESLVLVNLRTRQVELLPEESDLLDDEQGMVMHGTYK